MNKILFTISEVAEAWACEPERVLACIKNGALPCIRIGERKSSWRIPEHGVALGLADAERKPPPKIVVLGQATRSATLVSSIGYVYFVRSRRMRLIKIGRAQDLKKRFQSLCGMSPAPLTLLAALPGAAREYEIHRRFADERRHGEWFAASIRLLQYADEVRINHGLPDWAAVLRESESASK